MYIGKRQKYKKVIALVEGNLIDSKFQTILKTDVQFYDVSLSLSRRVNFADRLRQAQPDSVC